MLFSLRSEGQIVCRACYPRLTDPPPPACFRCNKYSNTNAICLARRPHSALAGVITAAPYEGIMRELVHWLKYRRLGDAALPLATVRLRSRGYNQS